MKLKLLQLFLLSLMLSVGSAQMRADDVNHPKREMRGVWAAMAFHIDWPNNRGTTTTYGNQQKSEITAYLDKLKSYGMNTVFVQVRSHGDRAYKLYTYQHDGSNGLASAKYIAAEPYSSYVFGSRTQSEPAFDPLAYWVEEAHKRGMEIYCWINPYRMLNQPTGGYTLTYDNNVKDWLMTYTSTDANGNQTTSTIFNPGHTSVPIRIRNVCIVLTGNYDIDGILFDDYFYPNGIPETSAAPDYALWQQKGSGLSFGDWRRKNINDMLKTCHAAIHAVKPWVRFGVGPAGISGAGLKDTDGVSPTSKYFSFEDWQYAGIYSDPVAWMRDKSVDFVSPQIYWTTYDASNPTHKFQEVDGWWSEAAQVFGRPNLPSHTISALSSANTTDNFAEIAKQIDYNRSLNRDGQLGTVLYSARYIARDKTGLGEYLRDTGKQWQYKSVSPEMTWYSGSNPGKITGLTKSSSTLTWTAMTNMRYIAYAIPTSVRPSQARSEKGGFRAEYIVDMSYTNSVSISGKTSGYWYAVAPYDRYGHEWEATTLNAPSDLPDLAKPTLVSPDAGKICSEYNDFTIKGVEHATGYTIQFASDAKFADIAYSTSPAWVNNGDGTFTFTFNTANVANGQYYWRVVATASGYNDCASDSRLITLTNLTPMEKNYTPYVESEAAYEPSMIHDYAIVKFANQFVRSAAHNPLGLGDGTTRDMTARAADISQPRDLVYIIERSANGSSATTWLNRFDGETGVRYTNLNLSYDTIYKNGYMPGNGVMVDDDNNLLVHSMSLGTQEMSLGKVDPVTGAVTTLVSWTPGKRTDHICVYGSVDNDNYYIFQAQNDGSKTYVSRLQVNNGNVVATHTTTLSKFLGAAPRVQALALDRVVVDGANGHPTIFTLPANSGQTGQAVGELPSTVAPNQSTPIGMHTFKHGNTKAMLGYTCYAHSGYNTGLLFSLYRGSDLYNDYTGITRMFTFPNVALGTTVPTGGDTGTIISSLDQSTLVSTQSIDNEYQQGPYHVLSEEVPTRLYVYAPGNGLSAYNFYQANTTGVTDVKADEADAAAPQYFTLQGVRVDGNHLTPGIYVRLADGKARKIVIR